ncbi:uncharacterized protein LOC127706236 isoform X3 [Mytilus californianus]|uniref:uncharacterized protein LOC127706236 isoform X3 n=1 Tax=Mytilus californianus TaxID=6549 RepID=UPI00224844A8|nr:uncharacterized protein LOC127706236 isoform X3 [Mytilus californianus]
MDQNTDIDSEGSSLLRGENVPVKGLGNIDIMRPTDLAAAHHYDKVVGVITKEPCERSDTEICQIKSWFQKKSDLFNQLNDEIIHDLIKNCEFMTVERDFVVIKQGEKGDCFFIILNGSVAIHINTTFGLDDDRQENTDKPDPLKERRDSREKQDDEKPKELDRSKFGNYVGKIESGKSFGELALINTDCVRNATIIADEAIDLIVIDRDLYNRCIKSFHAKEFADRKRFVETNTLFDRWHPKYKKQMAMSLRKEKLNFESVIVKQGALFDGLRFILSGQTKLTSDPYLHSMQYPDYYPLPDVEDLERVEARESLRRELSMHSQKMDDYKKLVPSRQKYITQDTGKNGKRSPKSMSHRQIELCLIGSEEIVGDMEVAMDLHTYSYSVTCIQETEIYILDQKNYERLIEKRNPQVVEMIRNSVLEKYSLRLSWMQDKKDLPLFRYLLYKIEENERKKKLKKEELMRQDKERDTTDDWMVSSLKKGPLIDMFGPGSVFYSIRMKAKQREMEKLSYKARVDKRRVLSERKSPAQTKPIQVQGANPTSFVTQAFKNKYDVEIGAYDFSSEDDVENDSVDGNTSRSQLICDKSRNAHSAMKETAETDFEDWESSDANLCKLENRLQNWYKHFGDNGKKRDVSIVKLRRYQSEDPGKPPLPGKKIFIRTKAKTTTAYLDSLKHTLDDDHHISRMHSAPARVKCHSAPPVFRRVCCAETMMDQKPKEKRPASSYRSPLTPTLCVRTKRPKSAHQYTAQEYEALKAEMKHRQRSYRTMYYDRPMSAYL